MWQDFQKTLKSSDACFLTSSTKPLFKIQNNKARDRYNMTYELFKPQYAGADIYMSLTCLFNMMKDQLIVPEFLSQMSITRFYKHRGQKSLFSNQRGIFNLSKIRSILDKVIYTSQLMKI